MKVDKFRLEDVFPSQDGSLKLILIDHDGDKHILHYPKSHEHVYFNDMYFFMNQGYIVLDNNCIPVNPIILTDDMIGKQVQLLNGQIHTVYRGMHDSHYTIGKHLYDCFGHTRGLPTNPISEDIRVINVLHDRIPKELFINLLKKLDSLNDRDVIVAFNTISKILKSK